MFPKDKNIFLSWGEHAEVKENTSITQQALLYVQFKYYTYCAQSAR